MIIRKNNKKQDSIIVGIWFETKSTNRFDNGKKSMIWRISLSDIKNHNQLRDDIQKFLKNKVQE